MDEKEAALLAQSTLHETLLVNLWAQMLLTSPDPERALRETMESSMASLEAVLADKMRGREVRPDVIPHLRPAALNFWLKVELELTKFAEGR